jgi:hypothetical protein
MLRRRVGNVPPPPGTHDRPVDVAQQAQEW